MNVGRIEAIESRSTSTQRPLHRYKRKTTKSMSFCKVEEFEWWERKKEDKRGTFFKADLLLRILEQNPNQIQSIPWTALLPVRLCPGNLSPPATQLRIPYDCTSPVIKPVPTVFPATQRSLTLSPQHSSASNYCFSQRQRIQSLVSSQESANWPASICMLTDWWQA